MKVVVSERPKVQNGNFEYRIAAMMRIYILHFEDRRWGPAHREHRPYFDHHSQLLCLQIRIKTDVRSNWTHGVATWKAFRWSSTTVWRTSACENEQTVGCFDCPFSSIFTSHSHYYQFLTKETLERMRAHATYYLRWRNILVQQRTTADLIERNTCW
jgi:hypothetical protein